MSSESFMSDPEPTAEDMLRAEIQKDAQAADEQVVVKGEGPDARAVASELSVPAPVASVQYVLTPAVMIVPLAYPLEADGVLYERLEFRPPPFATVERVIAGEASEIEMHAEMAGIATHVFRALRWPDAETAIAAARHIAPSLSTRRG